MATSIDLPSWWGLPSPTLCTIFSGGQKEGRRNSKWAKNVEIRDVEYKELEDGAKGGRERQEREERKSTVLLVAVYCSVAKVKKERRRVKQWEKARKVIGPPIRSSHSVQTT